MLRRVRALAMLSCNTAQAWVAALVAASLYWVFFTRSTFCKTFHHQNPPGYCLFRLVCTR